MEDIPGPCFPAKQPRRPKQTMPTQLPPSCSERKKEGDHRAEGDKVERCFREKGMAMCHLPGASGGGAVKGRRNALSYNPNPSKLQDPAPFVINPTLFPENLSEFANLSDLGEEGILGNQILLLTIKVKENFISIFFFFFCLKSGHPIS